LYQVGEASGCPVKAWAYVNESLPNTVTQLTDMASTRIKKEDENLYSERLRHLSEEISLVSGFWNLRRIRPPWAREAEVFIGRRPARDCWGRCHDLSSLTGLLVPTAAKPPYKSWSNREKTGRSGALGISEMDRERDQGMLMVLPVNWIMEGASGTPNWYSPPQKKKKKVGLR